MSDETASAPRRRPRQSRSRETVDALIEATARVLVKEGVEAASTNRIARAAGVSIGSLYQYFPNKEALIAAVAERHSEQMIALLERHAVDLATAPVAAAVPTYVAAMFEAHRVAPELHQALLPYFVAQGLDRFGPFQGRVITVVRAWLELHRDEVLPRNLDAAALVLVGAVEVATHASFAGFGASPLAGPDAVESEITDLVLRYLLGGPTPAP